MAVNILKEVVAKTRRLRLQPLDLGTEFVTLLFGGFLSRFGLTHPDLPDVDRTLEFFTLTS